ncbi:MAG TPA: hypothetical protein VJR47_00450 [Stellaceae bacterium]|nr:hypothetical protein [Stellaceae bacterium]
MPNYNRRIALARWFAGLLIGLTPLLAHFLLWLAGRPDDSWNNNWSADILLIGIINSGLSAVLIFPQMTWGDLQLKQMKPYCLTVWGLTLLIFGMSSVLYGAAVTGRGGPNMWWVSVIFLIASGFCSLNFDLALVSIPGAVRTAA